MKNLKTTLSVIALTVVMVSPSVFAKKAIMTNTNGQECVMVETAQLSVSFSNVPVELKSSRAYVEQQADDIFVIAADLGIGDIQIQNMNYNVFSNNSGGCNAATPSEYKLNGNISFKITDSKQAAILLESISDKGYNVNFNMNAYRQCQ